MHWTAYLAYRRFEADTPVGGDVKCVHCRYNLRGLNASGRCPECGHRISESLFVLVQPIHVSHALRGISNSYLTLLAPLLGMALAWLWPSWMITVIMIIVMLGSIYRFWCASELCFKTELRHRDELRSAAHLMWLAMGFDALAATAVVATFMVIAYGSANIAGGAADVLPLMYGLWLLATVLGIAAAGRFAGLLAARFAVGWLIFEARAQQVATLTAAVALILLILLMAAPITAAAQLLGLLFVTILLLAWLVITWVTLHHVANTGENQQDSLEELLEPEG